MALDKDAMAALIKTNIQALSNYPEIGQTPIFSDDRVLKAFCQGIIDHFQAAAVVGSTGTVTSGAGAGGGVVTTGTVS